MVSNRDLLFQGVIFRCHVSFREGRWIRPFGRDGISMIKATPCDHWGVAFSQQIILAQRRSEGMKLSVSLHSFFNKCFMMLMMMLMFYDVYSRVWYIFPNCWWCWWIPPPKLTGLRTWKWMVGIRSFPFGARPIFRGYVSFRECKCLKSVLQFYMYLTLGL